MDCPELDPKKRSSKLLICEESANKGTIDKTVDQDDLNVILRKTLVLFFIIPLLTYAVIRIPICLCSYYKDEVEKNERNSNWIETSGTITGIVHYDRIRTKTVGRKWRRRTKFIKVTHEKLEYEYRDMYGYKHDGRVTFEKSPSPDWENGKVELIDIDPNAKEIKVYYDPKRTAYSRLNADGTDNSYIIIIILFSIITAGLLVLDVKSVKYIFKSKIYRTSLR